MNVARQITGTLIFLLFGISCFGQHIEPFRKGDRVVFTGNSITDGGHYHSYIWLYYITRFPDMPIKVFNAGIGGDVARQIDERLQTDVFDKNPTVITLTFGMNDTGYQFLKGRKADSVFGQKISLSHQNFLDIEKKLGAHPQVRKILIASSPYDETSKIKTGIIEGKNAAILKISGFMKQAAAQNHWGFVDFNQPMQEINSREQQNDPMFTMEGTDRIHPTNDGHMVMAYLFLKAQGFAGKKVAAVAINMSVKTVSAENCAVTGLTVDRQTISFDYLAKSLPYPLDTIPQGGGKQSRSQADAMTLVPFMQEFDQENLQISGLKADQDYVLKIDNLEIGRWKGNDFYHGINLAAYHSTPQYQQALAIMHLNEERWQIERRLREYYWLHYSILKPKGMLFNDNESTVDSLERYAKKDFFVAVTLSNYRNSRFKSVRDAWQKETDLLTDELYLINKPQRHHFTITPEKS